MPHPPQDAVFSLQISGEVLRVLVEHLCSFALVGQSDTDLVRAYSGQLEIGNCIAR
jgi:hypothetical protein